MQLSGVEDKVFRKQMSALLTDDDTEFRWKYDAATGYVFEAYP